MVLPVPLQLSIQHDPDGVQSHAWISSWFSGEFGPDVAALLLSLRSLLLEDIDVSDLLWLAQSVQEPGQWKKGSVPAAVVLRVWGGD